MTVCARCNKPLRHARYVHAVEGLLYCSKECAVEALTKEIIETAKDAAIERYLDGSELVNPEDIGLDKEDA